MDLQSSLANRARYLASFSEHAKYLNFASLGPASAQVIEIGESLSRAASTGQREAGLLLAGQEARAIAYLSKLSGFSAQNIVLVPNTSSALVQIAIGLPIGTTIIAGGYQFPANVWPWRNAGAMGRLKTKFIGGLDEPVTPELIRSNLCNETDCVAISAVDFRTGYVTSLSEMREAIGDRLLIVDAIQGFGVVDQDWSLADVVISGGQKWMRAGQGTGFMALSDRALDCISPIAGNWAGIKNSLNVRLSDHSPLPGAARFEATRFSPVLAGCFAEALKLIDSVSVTWIGAEIAKRQEFLQHKAAEFGLEFLSCKASEARAGIAVIRAPSMAAISRIHDAGYILTFHDDLRIRVSMHATTQFEALSDLLSTLSE
ncbi:aminotransferase class V-fold PLP-dependent enzyme [Brucella sp. 21LCYQ03]|nr:aminotransferase class V-fold PLP-dependent enzyme [Brucella sp. 21LCYQ03]